MTTAAPSGEQIELAFAEQRAVVVEIGGGLRTYSAGGRELLDGYADRRGLHLGPGQVLIPWPNRLEDGSYEFDGRSHQLPLSEPDRRNAIHGLVRRASWSVAEREPDRAVVEYMLEPRAGYPFTLELSIEYALSATGLRVRTTATNTGSETCPYGSGAHPYLSIGSTPIDPAVLRVPARTVLRCDERGLPVGSDAVEGTENDFRRGRPIGSTRLDHAFTDLEWADDGLARVELRDSDAGVGLTLWVDESYPYLMLFSGDPLPDVDRRSLAVEPMTCPPNAFRTGEALIRLAPGDSVTSTWGISPTATRD